MTGPTDAETGGARGSARESLRVRELRDGDLPALAALTEGSARPLTAGELTLLVLADPDPRRSIVLVADADVGSADAEPLGYVHVAREEGTVYLVSGAVHPACRRRGIGTLLLSAALAQAGRWGAESIAISGRPLAYAAPGIDETADPDTAAFLRARGARAAGSALAMERDLTDLADDGAAAAPALPPGVRIAPCTVEEVPEMLDAVHRGLSEDWAQLLGRHVARRAEEAARRRRPNDGPAGTILLARDARDGRDARDASDRTSDGATGGPAGPASHAGPVGPGGPGGILGVAAWDVVGADPERFGPIGVLPAARGRGVGGALLDAALESMARAGAHRAWFQWTSASGPAHRLYLSRRFRPLATTTPFVLPVQSAPPTAAPTSKERTRP